jgi:hypothetical protein
VRRPDLLGADGCVFAAVAGLVVLEWLWSRAFTWLPSPAIVQPLIDRL